MKIQALDQDGKRAWLGVHWAGTAGVRITTPAGEVLWVPKSRLVEAINHVSFADTAGTFTDEENQYHAPKVP